MKAKIEKISCGNCDTKSASLMRFLNEQGIEYVDEKKSCNAFKKGQTIFMEGNTPLGLYCVKSGAVKLYKTGSMGKDQIIKIVGGGDFIGYRALIAEEPYSATAEAVADTVCCFIPQQNFFEMVKTQPDFSKQMMKSLCHELGVAGEQIMNMAQKSVRERLAETVLILMDHFSIPQADDTVLIDLQLPREDLANLTGASSETTIRLLTEFKEDNLIRFEGKKMFVTNPVALRKIARMN